MHDHIKSLLGQVIFGNSTLMYLAAIFMIVFGMAVVKLIIHRIVLRIKKLAEKTVTKFDDFLTGLLESIVVPLLYFVLAYLALNSLIFPEMLKKILNYSILGVFTFFAVKAAVAFINYGLSAYLEKKGTDTALEKSLSGIMVVIRLAIWAGAVIFFLDNLGFKVSAVIAGLGIGGVAVALAAQAVLKDLFSYFCILFDQPFKTGDFIVIGDFMGNIEHIGIRTTRIRSLSGEMLIFSNSDLTDSRLRNYKLMDKRRVAFKIGVVYQTPLAQLKEIPNMIKGIITGMDGTVFDRAHLLTYGDFSVIFEIAYYVIGNDYNRYMDIQQAINFAIKEEFEKRKIEFAYPTQTIILNKAS